MLPFLRTFSEIAQSASLWPQIPSGGTCWGWWLPLCCCDIAGFLSFCRWFWFCLRRCFLLRFLLVVIYLLPQLTHLAGFFDLRHSLRWWCPLHFRSGILPWHSSVCCNMANFWHLSWCYWLALIFDADHQVAAACNLEQIFFLGWLDLY